MFLRAERFADTGKDKQAIEIYTKIIKRSNRLPYAYYSRGICYMSIGEYSKALTDFNKTIDLERKDNNIVIIYPIGSESKVKTPVEYYDVLFLKAQAEYYVDSFNAAFSNFQYLVDREYNEKSSCILWQGEIYRYLGKKDSACVYFSEAEKYALTLEDIDAAQKMLVQNCGGTNNNR